MRFSLRTLFALLAAVALAGWLWHGYRQSQLVRELQEKNSKLHQELRVERGELEITEANKDKLQAIRVPTIEPMTWKWRVYIPPGRQFWINHIVDGISDDNLPENGSGCSLHAGEQVLTIALRKNEATGNWQWIERCGDTSCGPILSPARAAWIENAPNRTSQSAAEAKPAVVEPGKTLEMLRYRAFPRPEDGGPQTMSGVADGILVWIREEKRK